MPGLHPSSPVGEHSEETLTAEAVRMLDFARRWAPFGGGDAEDIFTSFGISSQRFFLRVQQLLAEHPSAVPNPAARSRLAAVCADRLQHPDPTGRPAPQAFIT
ncbi:MAG: hypothetical protein C0482_21775 [Gordonia sp.]|nr:hypothetical protein [Gordonia sp. (in: high G+C Gram-positive bacteria)]